MIVGVLEPFDHIFGIFELTVLRHQLIHSVLPQSQKEIPFIALLSLHLINPGGEAGYLIPYLPELFIQLLFHQNSDLFTDIRFDHHQNSIDSLVIPYSGECDN